jgi:nitrous oxide reductase accessory protein NosL
MNRNWRNKYVGFACAMAFLLSATARADAPTPKPVTAAAGTNVTTNAPSSARAKGPKGKVIITGSNIPQDFKKIGHTTDSISPVLVIDQQDIQWSGATTVGQVLQKRVPFATTGTGR